MKNYIKNALAIGSFLLVGGASGGGDFNDSYGKNDLNITNGRYESYKNSKLEEALRFERERIFEQRIKEQNCENIKLPNYSLPAKYCSRYARISAKKLFNKSDYSWSNSWDLQYHNKLTYKFKENETTNDSTTYESMKNLIINGTLKPGMLAVAKRKMNPNEYMQYSSENQKPGRDEMGKKIDATHTLTYMGLDKKGNIVWLHQWGKKREKIVPNNKTQEGNKTYSTFEERDNLKPTLIIDEPDKTSL